MPETLLTNDPNSARDFGRQLEVNGAGGAVCTPLTGDAAWLITDSNWSGLTALQKLAPACLTEPHGPTQCVCVIGDRIVWDGAPPREAAGLERGLLRLAEATRLDLVEVVFAPVRRGLAVVFVEQLVQLEHFHALAREQILDALVDSLTGEKAHLDLTEEALA
jgi:hypothetical protein